VLCLETGETRTGLSAGVLALCLQCLADLVKKHVLFGVRGHRWGGKVGRGVGGNGEGKRGVQEIRWWRTFL